MRRVAFVALAAFLLLGAPGGLLAFNAGHSGTRSGSASVVASSSGYAGVSTLQISASTVLGYAVQTGVNVVNKGPVTTTYTWTTTSDPSGLVTAATNCPTSTASGSTCSVLFTGPAKLPGTYTFTGTVSGTGPNFRVSVPGVTVTVKYCTVPPC
jgi:hypothetical protein